MSSSSSSLLPDTANNYPVYMRSSDAGANFISSKLTANSPSSSPSLYTNHQGASPYSDQQMLLHAVHHHRPSYSPSPKPSSGGYENRAMTTEPATYTSQERAQLGLMTRMEDHLIKKQLDAQLNKVSHSAAAASRASTNQNHILAQIQSSREIAMQTAANENETFY